MILRINKLLSVAKLARKSITHQQNLMYFCTNKRKQAILQGKFFLLLLFICATISSFQLVQAQTTGYTTTTSTTATKFQIYYGPETTLDQMIGMEMAANIWSQFLADNVTIKLFASTTSGLPKNVLGSSTPEMLKNRHSYEELHKQLSKDKKSANDFTSDKNRLKFPYLSVMLNGKVIENVDKINMTRANAKALRFLAGKDTTDFDGHIVLAKDLKNLSNVNQLTWSYNYKNNKIPPSNLDFLTTVIHEMGHILGFVSGIDNPHLEAAVRDQQHPITDDVIDQIFTPLDLYRFSKSSKNQAIKYDSGKYSWRGIPDISIGRSPFFTFDKGNSIVQNTATGEEISLGGDGVQGSHWKQGTDGIMNPYLQSGKRKVITDKDLTALDLMGWDVRSPAMGLSELAANLPTLYEQAKKTAQEKIKNPSTWILLSPPELVNPVGGDAKVTYTFGEGNSQSCSSNNGVTYCYNSSGSTSCSSNNGVTSCFSETGEVKTISPSSLDSSLKTFCQNPQNQSQPNCILWRASFNHKYWDAYYQKMIFLNQKWLPEAPTNYSLPSTNLAM
ncbi:hypothetical protein H6G41_29105 [Tolypothrix sp. FACHB-123]|nr:hypothetical protein [Tolypothrix sp. FACHB-123]